MRSPITICTDKTSYNFTQFENIIVLHFYTLQFYINLDYTQNRSSE